jgi:K+-transporting ATPase KdpF subunit
MCNSAIEFAEETIARQITMNTESIVMLIVSAGLMVYLLYALLKPEKF